MGLNPDDVESFNGAATFRSRKVLSGRRLATSSDLLQWGRDLSVAEGGGRRKG